MYEETLAVGRTILDQLGGNRFRAMTGAHSFVAGPTGLTFQIPRSNALKASHVRITLTGCDDYDVDFIALRNFTETTKAQLEGIGAENLRQAFSHATGLATAL